MNNLKKYIIGFVVGLLGVGTITYAAGNGTIGDLFVQVGTEWKLTGDSIQDNTIDNSEIEYSDTYTINQLGIGTSTPSKKIHIVGNGTGVDSRMLVLENSNTSDSNANANIVLKANGGTRGGIRFHGSNRGIDDKFNETITYNFNDKKLYFIDGEDGNSNFRMTIQSDGKVGIGTTSPTEKLDVVGNILADQYLVRSDARFKKDITILNNSLEKILSLNGYSYIFKSTGKKDIGLIAQEVEDVYPDLVHTGGDGYKSVQYQNLVAPLIEAIKAQQVQIDNLQKEIELLKNK